MIVLLFLVFYYLFVEFSSTKISAVELAKAYNLDSSKAKNKFLNEEIELTGSVKAYYQFEGKNNLLELDSENNDVGVYCIITSEELELTAEKLIKGSKVKIKGKCLGLANGIFPNSVYIEVGSLE